MKSEYRKGLSLEKAGDFEGALKVFDDICEAGGDEEIANYARVRASNIRIDLGAKAEEQERNELPTSDSPSDEPLYAGFWVRFFANLIDAVIFGVVFTVPVILIYGVEYINGTQSFHGVWDMVFTYAAPFVATIGFWLRFSATPGKMVIGLEVVDAKTSMKLSVKQAIVRYFAYIPSLLVFCLGFIWIAVDRQKKGWHDKLSGTAVVYKTS